MQTNRLQHPRKEPAKKTPKKKATPITIDSFFDSDNEDAMDYSSPRIASAKTSSDVRRISFDLEPEVHEIAIENYQGGLPKCIYRDPNKPYVFRKIDDLTDDQSKSGSTLGSVRARAKAIIMDRLDSIVLLMKSESSSARGSTCWSNWIMITKG